MMANERRKKGEKGLYSTGIKGALKDAKESWDCEKDAASRNASQSEKNHVTQIEGLALRAKKREATSTPQQGEVKLSGLLLEGC